MIPSRDTHNAHTQFDTLGNYYQLSMLLSVVGVVGVVGVDDQKYHLKNASL